MLDFEKQLDLLNVLIDDRINMYGVINTIQYLLDYGLTKEELIEMMFESTDIDYAIECDELEN